MCRAMPFDKLVGPGREKALENARQWVHEDGDLTEALESLFSDRLEAVGLPIGNIRWRLGYSQGDGMAFYGRVNLSEYLEKNNLTEKYFDLIKAEERGNILITIEKSKAFHLYDHHNTMLLEREFLDSPTLESMAEDLTEEMATHIRGLSRELEAEGYKLIEEETSEENLIRNLNPEYRFHPNGELCPEWVEVGQEERELAKIIEKQQDLLRVDMEADDAGKPD